MKLEEFAGERGERYRRWRKAAEAARHLYELDDPEYALLIYLATRGKARECLEIMEVPDMVDEGGLAILWSLLDAAYDQEEKEKYDCSYSLRFLLRITPTPTYY